MAFISQEELNHIRNSASIVDVISSYLPLTQKGKNYFGVCPFHEDHSPSMSVSSEKQIYKCFSCGATGNVFTFVENFLNVSFIEAVEIVARQVGISIQTPIDHKKSTPYQEEYALMDFVLKLFQNNLNTEAGVEAIHYLKKRNLLEETRKEFCIGLSLENNVLYSILKKKDYKEKMLVDLGLIQEKNGQYYDVFRNRIMFPIHNLDGQVVGFTARCYKKEETPKYLNTKETYLFKKGMILFNYHRAKDSVRLTKQIIVVEGNMDAIRLSSVGIKNVVAIMGTSLTKEQINALKKLHAKVILMLDNDQAGETATYAIGSLLEENHLDFSVVRLSGEKDPDEYIIKNGKEAMLDAIKNAISFMDFKLKYFKQNKNLNEASDLAEYIKAVLNSLKNNDDEILKEITLQKLSNDYNISYAILKEQLGENEKKKEKKYEASKPIVKESKTSYDRICEKILYYMMHQKNFVKLYQTKLGIFPTKKYRSIANEILYYVETHKTINLADFITYAENTNLKEEIMDIINNEREEEFSEEGMLELLGVMKRKIKQEEILKIKKEIQQEMDVNKKVELLEKIAEIKMDIEEGCE